MSDIFREVDEDVRTKEVEELARRYGPFLAAAALLLVGLYGGYAWWQNDKTVNAGRAGDQLLVGIEAVDEGNPAAAIETFAGLANDGPQGYQLLSRFQLAAAQRNADDLVGALATYDSISDDTRFDAIYRELAILYGGYTLVGMQTSQYDEILARMQPLIEGESPWRFQALELLGFAAIGIGNYEAAESHLTAITDDSAAPTGVARRADELLNVARGAAPETAGN